MAEVKSVAQIIREINKEFGEIVHRGVPKNVEGPKLISMGSISLDFCIYGGLTEGRFYEFSGPESSGKTTMACLAAGSYQRTYPDKKVLFVDMEGTFDFTWGEKLGLKTGPEQFIYYETVGQSGETVTNHIVAFLKTGEVGFIIIDSLPMLVPNFVQDEDDMEQKSMGGNAKLLSDFTTRYCGLVRKQRAIVIGINQLRDNMTKYGDPVKTTGGRAWKHNVSGRFMFKRGDFFGQDGEKVKKKDAQSPAGHIIEMYVLKNKNSPWDRKLGFTRLHYWKGIDYVGDLTEVAIHFGLIDNSSVGWFRFFDENGEIMKDKDGKDIKINGKLKLAEYLKNNKEISARLYHKVKEMMLNKEPGYIQGFEEMLGVDKELLAKIEEASEEDE